MSMRCALWVWLLPVCLLGILGCINHHVDPTPGRTPVTRDLCDLSLVKAVTLRGETNRIQKPVKICTGGVHRYFITFDELTQGVLVIARDILVRHHVAMRDNADRQLTIAITDVKCEIGFWTLDYIVRLKVKTGRGHEREFIGMQSIGDISGTAWAVEKASVKAVLAMLNDCDILSYLQHTP